MNNQKGLISALILIISLILVVVIVGGAIYLDSTDSWNKLGLDKFLSEDDVSEEDNDSTEEEQQGEEVIFVPYQSPDQLYQLQIPDFWTSEERAEEVVFRSYNLDNGLPERRAEIEVDSVANSDLLTTAEWLVEQDINVTNVQEAIFGSVSGSMILEDNTDINPGDIKSVIYMPVNDQVLIITAESFGGTRDVAVQFFNAILNSWQWLGEVTSPDQLVDESIGEDLDADADIGDGDSIDDGEPIGDNPEDDILEGDETEDGDSGDISPEEVLE